MITKALLARFQSRHHADDEVAEFLRDAQPLVASEPGTVAWFAVRFGRGDFGVFDVFADEAGRAAHLDGAIAASLMATRDSLLAGPPTLEHLDVLACKLPPGDLRDVTKGLLLTFKAKEGREAEVAAFLRDARRYIEDETGTRAWFAIRIDAQHFGIFDVFPDTGARFAHLTGQVPREFAKQAFHLLGGMPDMHMLDIVCVSSEAVGDMP